MTSTALVLVLTACGGPSLSKRKVAVRPVTKTHDSNSRRQAAETNSPLHRATTYWESAFHKNPKDPKAGLAYALNLKALGAQEKAFSVLGEAHRHNPTNPEIASEYGRLALVTGRVKLAQRLLEMADAPGGKPDWKLLSAQGTVHAKLGEHDEAQRYFMAALQEKPDAPSVLNNLALSYAMDGKPEKAEALLRRAVDSGSDTPRLRQNLALVLGLQGKFDEAGKLAELDLPGDQVQKNVTYLRNMVKRANAVVEAPDTDRTGGSQVSGKTVSIVPAAVRQAEPAARKTEGRKAERPAAREPVDAEVKPAPHRPAKRSTASADSSRRWRTSVNEAPTSLKPSLQ